MWFGEQVYEGERINRAVANCEVFAVIGTSGVVHPAAGLVEIAADHGAQTVLIDLDIDAHEDLYDFAYEGPASECVPHWVREMMLRHGEGVLRGHEGQDLSGELVQNIANFVQAERYGRAVDLGERHTPEGLPELLKELGLRAEEHEFHEARYQLEPLMAGLLYDDGNSGEGGSYAFGVHLSSYGASTGPILTDLHQAQIEHAADLIAWTIADIGLVPDASPKENDQNFNINKLTSSFTGEV